jgi:DNA-binding IclR family transcriptional regulator
MSDRPFAVRDSRDRDGFGVGATEVNLTLRQQDVLEIIRREYALTGSGVGCAVIGDAMGVTRVTAWEHLNALQRKGAIENFGDGRYRTFRPVEHADAATREAATFLRAHGMTALATRLEAAKAAGGRRVVTADAIAQPEKKWNG